MSAVVQLFPSKQVEPPVQEARVADCDDGYTRLANDILETAYKVRLNGNAMSVLLAVVRMTYGWNKTRDRIAGVQIADETELSESEVSRAISQLVERNIITVEGDKRKVKTIGINKKIDEWILRKPARSHAQTHNSDCANAQVGLRKSANTKDISPKTLIQRQDLKPLGPKTADAAPDPVAEQDVIPPDAAIHVKRGKTLRWGTQDDLTCATWLIETRAKAFTMKGLAVPKSPELVSWVNDVRLMRQHDNRTHREICELFSWVCKTGRELAFCQSPATLRDKWDGLQLRKANSDNGVTGNHNRLGNVAAAQAQAQAIIASGMGGYDDDTIL